MIAPFLIILVIVIVAFLTIFMKRTFNRRGKYVYSHRVRWIFCGYLAILLICAGMDTVLPVKGRADMKMVHTEDLEKESLALYNDAKAGRIDKVDPSLIAKKWSFDFHERELNLAVANDEFLDIQIFVERKKMNDDKIEAVFYQTRSSMNDMDITKLINPPLIKLGGNGIMLINPNKSKIDFSRFQNIFTVTQFTGGSSFFEHHSDFFEGQRILYLRIPKDLELLNKTDLNLQFVE
jgi:hypothetical protein